jgi:hypothetical protein
MQMTDFHTIVLKEAKTKTCKLKKVFCPLELKIGYGDLIWFFLVVIAPKKVGRMHRYRLF